MKAISLWQPWATLLAHGLKHIETRSWPTSYRGRLLIHASKKKDPHSLSLMRDEPFRKALSSIGISRTGQLPFGAILGTAELHSIWSTESCELTSDDQTNGIASQGIGGRRLLLITERERAFGDYRPGRCCWKFTDFRPFVRSAPWRGMQGLFEVDGICVQCGCTDDDCTECVKRTGVACSWVKSGLCSACA